MNTDLPDSQLSGLSLELSQETTHQIMQVTLGWKPSSDALIEQYHVMDGEESEYAATPDSGDSLDISIKRAVLHSYPQLAFDQGQQHEPSLASLACGGPLIPPLLGPCSPSGASPTSVVPTSVHSRTSEGFTPCSSFSPTYCLRSNIPENVPFPGDYGFQLVFSEESKATKSKSMSQTYSDALKRLYIKIDTRVPITFSFSTMPQASHHIRAMCMFKAPQMVGEVVQCCPKHLEDQKLKDVFYPYHFIRAHHQDAHYTTDEFSNHHSVILRCSSTQTRANSMTIIYKFPCYTSELSKAGQLIQVLFTLESHDGAVLGRCVTDLKVSASPGRDRTNDEERGAGGGGCDVTNTRKRKRPSSEVISSSSVSEARALSSGLSGDRKAHVIHTYPELIPYVDSMVQMLESVYKVRVVAHSAENESQSSTQTQSTHAASGQTVELLQIQVKKTTSFNSNN